MPNLLLGRGFLLASSCYNAYMIALFKNPWTWLLILFVVLSVGMGIFLFRGKSVRTMDKEQEQEISKEDSEDIVKKLEEGNTVPGEENRMENGEWRIEDEGQETMSDEQGAENNEQGVKSSEQEAVSEKEIVVNRLVSFGFSKANDRKIDTIVLHSTYNALGGDPFSVSKILDIYKSYGVAPHYLIARDGTAYRLVDEKNIAYHAGESEMKDGRENANDFSIGIEIIGKDDGSPSDEQYASLKKLLADIKTRHDIKYIVGHSDIAPGRKTDPWGFEWGEIGEKEL